MSTAPDGDGKVDDPEASARATGDAAGEPPERPSAMQLLADPAHFPDDGPVARALRTLDRRAGFVEQVVLVSTLATIVGTGVLQVIATKVFKHSFLWSFDVVRAGTFLIALLGAAYASQQASHLSMDLVSRKLAPRARQVMRLVMGLFTLGATGLFMYSGTRLTRSMWNEAGNHTIPPEYVAAMIPLGCALIIFHTLLHLLIDVDYMRRGKLPPEKPVSAH